MRWRYKAAMLRAVAHLPAGGEPLHYVLQSLAGGLRRPPDPRAAFTEFVKLARFLHTHGYEIAGTRVLEIGTGRGIDMPLAFYLAGAASVITLDQYRYLHAGRVASALDAVRKHRDELRALLDPLDAPSVLERRFDVLQEIRTLDELRRACRIEYRAPADAGATALADASIDLHFSYTVLEHVSAEELGRILREAARLLSEKGTALHHIDCSDHFAQEDASISRANFLRFSDSEWQRLAGNRYAYHNRLHRSDYVDLFRQNGHRLLAEYAHRDERSLREIRAGWPLDERFRAYSAEELASDIVVLLSSAASCAPANRAPPAETESSRDA